MHIQHFNGYLVAIFGMHTPSLKKFDTNKVIIKLAKKASKNQGMLQFFDASKIATWQHLYFALVQADRSFKTKTNIMNTLEMELLLHTSGQRQVARSLKKVGISSASRKIGVLIMVPYDELIIELHSAVLESFQGEEDDSVLEITKDKFELIQKEYGITKEEIYTVAEGKTKADLYEALFKSVVNRGALLALEK